MHGDGLRQALKPLGDTENAYGEEVTVVPKMVPNMVGNPRSLPVAPRHK
jgi:hypothetical protein